MGSHYRVRHLRWPAVQVGTVVEPAAKQGEEKRQNSTHILAWESQTGEPGGLASIGWQSQSWRTQDMCQSQEQTLFLLNSRDWVPVVSGAEAPPAAGDTGSPCMGRAHADWALGLRLCCCSLTGSLLQGLGLRTEAHRNGSFRENKASPLAALKIK